MSKRIQLRRGTTAEANAFTGAVGEVTVDTDKDTVVVHDGTTVGGHPVAARANADGTIELIKKDGTSAGTINALGLFNDTLTSANTNQALTAAQGKVLKDTLNATVASSFGVGQTWQVVTSSRSFDITYTNNTGRPIQVAVTSGGGSSNFRAYINGIEIIRNYSNYNTSVPQHGITLIIPNGSTYSFTGGQLQIWAELR